MSHESEFCPYRDNETHCRHWWTQSRAVEFSAQFVVDLPHVCDRAGHVDGECCECRAELGVIRSDLVTLSGSGKRLSTQRRHGLYSTMTLPGIADMPAVRDTVKRFEDFGVPEDLTGLTLLDVGSNVGAFSLEAAKRGASVVGVEYRADRVELCNRMARHWGLDAAFYQADLLDLDEETLPLDVWRVEYDLVSCCSVDEYVPNRQWLYSLLRERVRRSLYLESNVQRGQSESETLAMLYVAGFKDARYLGNGHSGGIARRRKLFVATV